MIDHLLGRPSPSWKRAQVFLVMIFWIWRILQGDKAGPRLLWLRNINRLLQRFTPWQIIVSTLTGVYALRNIDKIIGLHAPDPLANLYSPSYYRAVWIATGMDAGFATAMTVRPRWLRDICSVLFSLYYIIYTSEAQEKIRRYRAVPTVDMLRVTWEKATNPYIRAITRFSSCKTIRKILLPRPKDSLYQRPITGWLFFDGSDKELMEATDLILDVPGGGFISMTPKNHEERLRIWAKRSGKPILSIDYAKAPEYPYPFAIDEIYDAYRSVVESTGSLLGMSGHTLSIILAGDSAGATIAVNALLKLIETRHQRPLPLPSAVVLSYAALDFNFTSWMTPANLRVLRSEQKEGTISGEVVDVKDHFKRNSPLSMANERKIGRLRRRKSWRDAPSHSHSNTKSRSILSPLAEDGMLADMEGEDEGPSTSPRQFVASPAASEQPPPPLTQSTLERHQIEHSRPVKQTDVATIGTRITMTSRTGYFQDKIVTPSMMRAMALLYIGPKRNPDFATDYHISPVLTPAAILAQFPPVLMHCGEKDPFVDDSVIFAARIREAKRARKQELDHLLRSTTDPASSDERRRLRRERDRLARESEDDWVRLVLYEDWSHGYLQMCTLMPEAKDVANDLADWMVEAFAQARTRGSAGSPNMSEARDMAMASLPPQYVEVVPLSADTSETEGTEEECDSPISFRSRRMSTPRQSFSTLRRSSRPRRSGSDETLMRGSPPGSEGTLVDPSHGDGVAKAQEGNGRTGSPGILGLGALPRALGDIKGVSGGSATPTLTESELMKRRRLLDVRIFEQS